MKEIHILREVKQENAHSWAATCSCGWREKALWDRDVRARFSEHRKRNQT